MIRYSLPSNRSSPSRWGEDDVDKFSSHLLDELKRNNGKLNQHETVYIENKILTILEDQIDEKQVKERMPDYNTVALMQQVN